MQVKFTQELIDQVKSSYLITKYAAEFAECETDSDFCLTYYRVSTERQESTGLGSMIVKFVVSHIHQLSI